VKLVAIFVRHGETEANADHLFRGPLDYPLDEKGIEQAKKVREFLKNRRFMEAYRSAKIRTKQTADEVLPADVPVLVTKNLNAWNVGDLAGKPKTDKNLAFVKKYQTKPAEVIPGGESLLQFRKRVDPMIHRIIRRGEQSGVPTIAFVHSSIVHELSQMFYSDHQKVKVQPGGIIGVFKTPTGYKLKALYGESESPDDQNIGS
jgi:broad specificity phosphatase PhoE